MTDSPDASTARSQFDLFRNVDRNFDQLFDRVFDSDLTRFVPHKNSPYARVIQQIGGVMHAEYCYRGDGTDETRFAKFTSSLVERYPSGIVAIDVAMVDRKGRPIRPPRLNHGETEFVTVNDKPSYPDAIYADARVVLSPEMPAFFVDIADDVPIGRERYGKYVSSLRQKGKRPVFLSFAEITALASFTASLNFEPRYSPGKPTFETSVPLPGRALE